MPTHYQYKSQFYAKSPQPISFRPQNSHKFPSWYSHTIVYSPSAHYILSATNTDTRTDRESNLQLQSRLLALYAANDLLGRILGDDLVVVQHLKLLGGVAAHEVHDSLGTAGVLLEPVTEVHDDALDHDPEVFLGVVLGNLLHGVLLLRDLELLGLGGLGAVLLLGSGAGGGGGLLGDDGGAGATRSAGAVPLDSESVGNRGVKVEGDLADTLSGGAR